MKRRISDIAAKIEKEALRAGKRVIDGRKISSFNQELLSVSDGSLSEHLDIHAAAGLYYAAVMRRAQRLYDLKKARFDEWWLKRYAKANEYLMNKWGRRPNKVDVEQRVKDRYADEYKKYYTAMMKAKEDVATITSWLDMWKQKSFSTGHMEGLFHATDEVGTSIRSSLRGE